MEEKKEKLFIFIHGWKGHANYLFFQENIKMIEEAGLKSNSETYPNPEDPRYPQWKIFFEELLTKIWHGEDIYLIGHSLGGYFIFRILDDSIDKPWFNFVKGIIVLGSAATRRPEYKPFYDADIQFTGVHLISPKIRVIWSNDDPIIKHEHKDLLNSKMHDIPDYQYIELNGFGHFINKHIPEIQQIIQEFI